MWYNISVQDSYTQSGALSIYGLQRLMSAVLNTQRQPAEVSLFRKAKGMTTHAKLVTVQCPDCKDLRQIYEQYDGIVRKCRSCLKLNQRGPFIAGKNRILKKYQRWARERSLSWDLTDEQFSNITQQPCHYCGSEPSSISVPKRKYRDAKAEECFVYSGIDRVDNSIGYRVDNCVPCCRQCNYAKSAKPYDEFIKWLDRVAEFRCA